MSSAGMGGDRPSRDNPRDGGKGMGGSSKGMGGDRPSSSNPRSGSNWSGSSKGRGGDRPSTSNPRIGELPDVPRPAELKGPGVYAKVKPTWRGILNLIKDVLPISGTSLMTPLARGIITGDMSPYGPITGWGKTEYRDMGNNISGSVGNTGGSSGRGAALGAQYVTLLNGKRIRIG